MEEDNQILEINSPQNRIVRFTHVFPYALIP